MSEISYHLEHCAPYNFIAKINFQMMRKVKGKAKKIVTKKEKAKKTAMKKVRCFHEFFDQLQQLQQPSRVL